MAHTVFKIKTIMSCATLATLSTILMLTAPLSFARDSSKISKKNWTFIIYMAADNDLKEFSVRNIKQMASIGSNDTLNIVVQLDIKALGNKKITRRYYIEKNKVFHMNANDSATQAMDSGDDKTLISFCKWALQEYPADHYALVLWNHGSGVIDPQSRRVINPFDLYAYNPLTNKLDLDRTTGFLDLISVDACQDDRGICWDDSTGNYLTNQKLNDALNEICAKYLHKKFDIIGFDACLMAMLEIANLAKNYTDIMIGSEEVELGTGWNYQRVLSPFAYGTLSARDIATHIVRSYKEEYQTVTNDYTQSAIDLNLIEQLENNINDVALAFIDCLKKQKSSTFKSILRMSKDRTSCTHFDEPSYIDLHHFYTNMIANINRSSFAKQTDEQAIKNSLISLLRQGCSIIEHIVLANEAGNNLSKAKGISIYFPEKRIHQSYRKTLFASNKWITFLNHYLLI